MLTQEIRRKFLNYFQQKGHAIVPSSPVFPHDDPTLLFINAGMNQFKDVFLGTSERDYDKAATSQKCIRVGGKHNDLENVGHTKRHLTFFEMLGNFSFGDYFKEDAIRFAWEVSTEVFELDPDKIRPTVFEDDDEAFEIWTGFVPAERITRFGEKTNFWAMGETGPCGPCSELLYDRGEEFGDARNPKEDVKEERFLEFWNLVFMQYNKDEKREVFPLPKPSIDTGAGIERIVDLKMDAKTVYDTDVLRSLIDKTEQITGVRYDPENPEKAPAFRVIADHLRCLSFAIADGVQPGNVERGYVLRKVLRRAVRYGRVLGMKEPFLASIFPRLIETMGEDYPELKKAKDRVEEVLNGEEEAFLRTLKRGGNILNQVIEDAKKEKREISGEEAFKLKDTYGFPLEEILLIAKDQELKVDQKEYAALEEKARELSRSAHKSVKQVASENLFKPYEEKEGDTEFLGYTRHEADGMVKALVVDNSFVEKLEQGQEGLVVLDRTPFYAEKGGQVGDTGRIQGMDSLFEVKDTQAPYKGVIAHSGKLEKGSLHIGDRVEAVIDSERREKIANNHTVTHLLHWALQKVLGEHVKQAGSVVAPDRLRFDFTHHKAVSQEEVRQVEDLVNLKIRENRPVKWYELPFDEVQKKGEIKQFFGEKYGAVVRVIDIDFSKELCGGTHTNATGNIGLFKIAKESSISAGVRRIEAVTGYEAELFVRSGEELIESIAEKLKTQPQKLAVRVEKLLEEQKDLEQGLKQLKNNQLNEKADTLLAQVEKVNETPLIAAKLAISSKDLATLADAAMQKLKSGVLVLGSSEGEKCSLLVKVSDDLVAKGIKANEIIKTLSPIIQGGGGGKPNMAQAGGKAPEKMDEALSKAKEIL